MEIQRGGEPAKPFDERSAWKSSAEVSQHKAFEERSAWIICAG